MSEVAAGGSCASATSERIENATSAFMIDPIQIQNFCETKEDASLSLLVGLNERKFLLLSLAQPAPKLLSGQLRLQLTATLWRVITAPSVSCFCLSTYCCNRKNAAGRHLTPIPGARKGAFCVLARQSLVPVAACRITIPQPPP